MQKLRSEKDSSDENTWCRTQWENRWTNSNSHLKTFIGIPKKHPPGYKLPRKLWCRLNRARTGHGRFKYHMYKMGLSNSGACDCGFPQQTAAHYINDCVIHRCPVAFYGSESLDDNIAHWLGDADI
jgi:hypothetical protein